MARGLGLSTSLALLAVGPIGTTSSYVEAGDKSKGGPSDYMREGCYVDSKRSRIMPVKMKEGRMSAAICFEACNDGRYTHFGLEYGDECWCGEDPRLTVNGDKVRDSQCDMPCYRSDTGKCGGRDRMLVYKMTAGDRKDDKDGDRKDDKDGDRKDDKDDDRKEPKDDDRKDDKNDDRQGDKDDDRKDDKDDDRKDDKGDDRNDDKGGDRKDDKNVDRKDEKYYDSEGCYKDSSRNRVMSVKYTRRSMSAEICFDICYDGDYTHFGTQYGNECWCGKDPRLTANGDKVRDSQCDVPCARSDTEERCGGRDRMSVYKMKPGDRKNDDRKDDKDDDRKDDKSDDRKDDRDDDRKGDKDHDRKDDKGDDRKDDKDDDRKDDKDDGRKDDKDGKRYRSEGCYKDSDRKRIMSKKYTERSMSAEICHDICNDSDYTHFGTEYGKECWCGKESRLMANGGKVPPSECGMACAGSRTGETCGDRDRMSVYKMKGGGSDDEIPRYMGCYADRKSRRAMPNEKWEARSMTIKMCVSHCTDLGYKYAGVQYGKECWCGDRYDEHGESERCTMPCAGDDRKKCGGRDALSVYKC